MVASRSWCLLIVLACSLAAKEEATVHFDKGEKDDYEKGVVYKPVKEDNTPGNREPECVSSEGSFSGNRQNVSEPRVAHARRVVLAPRPARSAA